MKFQATLALILATSVLSATAATTTVYKSIGKHGEVRYTQLQPTGSEKYETLEIRSDGRTNDAGQQAVLPNDKAATTPEQQKIADLEKQVKDQQDKELAQRCQGLRDNLAALSGGSGPVFEKNAKGEKVYLNDQEISSRRQRQQEMLNQYCKSS